MMNRDSIICCHLAYQSNLSKFMKIKIMARKISVLIAGFLLILFNERCKTFAGANPSPSVWSSIASDAKFSIFRDLLQTTGWANKLNDKNLTYTVFAPTNQAFEKLGADKLSALQKPENRAQLSAVLENHIFTGSLDKEALIAAKSTPASVNGKTFPVERINNRWHVGNARPTQNPLFARNGIFYVIDAVLE
jgi:transforming growth factor-beta-induced protein